MSVCYQLFCFCVVVKVCHCITPLLNIMRKFLYVPPYEKIFEIFENNFSEFCVRFEVNIFGTSRYNRNSMKISRTPLGKNCCQPKKYVPPYAKKLNAPYIDLCCIPGGFSCGFIGLFCVVYWLIFGILSQTCINAHKHTKPSKIGIYCVV